MLDEGVSDEAALLARLQAEVQRRDVLLLQAQLLDEAHVTLASGHAEVLGLLRSLRAGNTNVKLGPLRPPRVSIDTLHVSVVPFTEFG